VPTVDDVARSIIAAVDQKSQVGPELMATWVFEAYKELVGKVQYKHLRRRFTIYAPAPYTSFTANTQSATFTQGSNLVQGTGTSFDMIHQGWFIRTANVWVRIVAVNPATQVVTLESPFSESTVTDGSFYCVQRYLPLPENIRWCTMITHPRIRRKIRSRTMNWLDSKYPSRLLIGPWPWAWAEAFTQRGLASMQIPPTGDAPQTTDRRKYVELYPPSNQDEQYDGTGWMLPDKFEPEDELPPEIDEYVLRAGVLEYFYNNRAMEVLEKSPEAAQVLLNKADRQHTRWLDSIQNAIVSDRLNDDVDVTVTDDEGWDYADIRTGTEMLLIQDAAYG
jgi:hypothetical protein